MKYRKLLNVLAVISLVAGLFTGFLATKVSLASPSVPDRNLGVSETGLYIVRLQDPAVASYMGGVGNLRATSPEATGATRLDPNSPASQAYYNYLANQQQGLLTAMRNAYGHSVEAEYQYLYALNAVAVRISHQEALRAFNLPGVLAVYPDKLAEMDTDMGPTLIGADAIWNGDTYPEIATQGEGIVIGMIDSGINSKHPSFAETDDGGYTHVNPYGAKIYHGWCATNKGFCNEKLIAAYNLYDPTADPEDLDGHGSHTSSTAGGNALEAYFTIGGIPFLRDISGVAPHANIVAYKICDPSCPNSAAVAAVDLAIGVDMVDVLNYSISGGDDPWNDSVDQAFLDATAAGIFVSASAGNTGPGLGTVAHSGPWNSSTAASTHSRIYGNLVDVTATGGNMNDIPSAPGALVSLTADFTAPIKYDAAYRYACTVTPIPPGTFTGKIALVQRGGCTFDEKMTNVYNAGATAMIVFNNAGGPPTVMGFTLNYIPGVMITLDDGLALSALITGDTTATATISATTSLIINTDWQDVLAGFSARGPSQHEVLKPDYTAPGVNILAAVAALPGEPVQYGFYQGTSMSSPHSAGAAALMMALQPEWSVVEVRSAMSTTADAASVLDYTGLSPATAWDTGSGRLDLAWAGKASLVMDETSANFIAANPDLGGDPKTLNMPYLVNYDCIGTCSWTRTVSSVLLENTIWDVVIPATPAGLTITVSPMTFELTQGNPNVTLTITADVTAAAIDDLFFAEVLLVPDTGTSTRLPVVVIASAPPPVIDVDPLSLSSTQLTDVIVDQTLTISNLGVKDLTWEVYEDSLMNNVITADWLDNFDTYTLGTIQGQGGWKGWFNDPAGAGIVSNTMALSAPNSQAILGPADSVHEYSGYTTGFWSYKAMQYIPTDFTGESMFILLNSYDDAGANLNWSVQVSFNGATNTVLNMGITGGTLPLIKGQWVEVRVDIDLLSDAQSFYYGGNLLYTASWTDENTGAGALNIGAVDLFANGASVIYYDDMGLVVDLPDVCQLPGDIPWLSVAPATGTTLGGASSPVTVTFDSTGLAVGTYTSTLCVASNDLVTPLVQVPLTLTVGEPVVLYPTMLPLMWKAPVALP
jgi:subtilisin family serine protease